MSGNKMAILSVALFVIASLFLVGFFYYQNQSLKKLISDYQNLPTSTPEIIYLTPSPISSPTNSPSLKPLSTQKACTMEAKMCPDGSYVGRTGPNCEFSPCP